MKQNQYNKWFLFTFLPWLTSVIIRLLYRTIRTEFVGVEHPQRIWGKGENFILAFWHDQLLLMAPGYLNAQQER